MDIRRYSASTVKLARTLTPRSFARYSLWRLRGNPHDIKVRLRDGLVAEVRGGGGDYWTISEIFFNGQYVMPPGAPTEVRTVVDTGANVGYACLWYLKQYPEATITAFEPLPEHVAQIEKHLRGNGLRDRVELIPAAAAVQDGSAVFADAGPESRPLDDGQTDGISVQLVDWYAHLPAGQVDVLKMDIEGGEIPLLEDPRFAELAARTRVMVLEWHKAAEDEPGGRDWCAQRMTDAGFQVTDGAQYYGAAGLLWGLREPVTATAAG